MKAHPADKPTILLTEADVILRLVLAEHLRKCGVTVVEAASGQEARAVLVAGPHIDIVMADAQLAGGDENGFALAQWARRYRPHVEVILAASIAHKVQAASEYCARHPGRANPVDVAALTQKIHFMLAERKRRMRPSAPAAQLKRRRR